jgi:predicted carbohydrate-binding protein with CBM5 and CBM33 domain
MEDIPAMTRPLRLAAVTGSAAMVLAVVSAAPAGAHGTLERPASRTAGCGTEGDEAGSAACRAALAASGRDQMQDWDNLRIANVAGRDRQVVPDGRLCSGGLDEYRGLDLARGDWPTTTLRAGTTFRFGFRTTIPHQGTFHLYVTRDGYDPTKPLAWSDLETEPFLTAADPPVRDGAYVMTGKLPADKQGRHLIYTVWQNSDTPDTYYSCSDVVFRDAAKQSKAPAAEREPTVGEAASTERSDTSAASRAPAPDDLGALAAANTAASGAPEDETGGLPSAPVLGLGLAALVAAAGGGLAVAARRRSRRE